MPDGPGGTPSFLDADLPFASEERLGLSLSGSLPCITCGYDLKGISIRGVCPECGTMVRATILYRIDPRADIFRPVYFPRITSVLLMLWGLGALVAALAIWIPRIEEIAAGRGTPALSGGIWSAVAFWAIAASAVGSASLVRPIQGMSASKSVSAMIGLLGYGLVVYGFTGVVRAEWGRAAPYFSGTPDPERQIMRLVMLAGMVVVLLGMRPSARELVKRCLALRTGRVDRQTILAMVAVTVVSMVGEGLRLLAPQLPPMLADMASQAGVVLIVVSSLLLTLGFASAVVDGWRLSAALVMPGPTLRDVLPLGGATPAGKPASGGSSATVAGTGASSPGA